MSNLSFKAVRPFICQFQEFAALPGYKAVTLRWVLLILIDKKEADFLAPRPKEFDVDSSIGYIVKACTTNFGCNPESLDGAKLLRNGSQILWLVTRSWSMRQVDQRCACEIYSWRGFMICGQPMQ